MNLDLDLSFTQTKPGLWDLYEVVLLVYGSEASEAEFEQIMGGAGYGDLDLSRLYSDFKWYLMCARPERMKRAKASG